MAAHPELSKVGFSYKRVDPNSEGLPQLLYIATLLSLSVSSNLSERGSSRAAEGFRAERAAHELLQVCKQLLGPEQMAKPREIFGRILPLLQRELTPQDQYPRNTQDDVNMSPSIRLALQVLSKTAGATSPEAKALRRRASIHLVRAMKRHPEHMVAVRAALEKAAAPASPANPALTAIKRVMIRAVPILQSHLQKELDLDWSKPSGEAKYGYVQYNFYGATKPNPTTISLDITPSEDKPGKLLVRLSAYQGYSNTRWLDSANDILEAKDLAQPNKVFPSSFISKIKKAMEGSFEDEIQSCVNNCDRILKEAEDVLKTTKEMKAGLEKLGDKAGPAEIVPLLKDRFDLTNAGRSIASAADDLNSISKRLSNQF